jgi:hypothetical protein
MKTKKNTASKIPDILIVLICLAGMFISLWMFWKDLNATMTKQAETPIGEIEFKRNFAQRRFLDRVVWDRLQQNSPIYNGDTIRTANLSEAIITFAGSKDSIQLGDSSIIQILMDEDGGARIDVSGGNINIDKQDSAASFTLVSGKNEIAVQSGSRINIQSDIEKEDINLTIMAGSASLMSEQGAITIDAGTALKVSSDGTAESFVTITDIIPYPESFAGVTSSANIPVEFMWNAVDLSADESVRLEIAKDRNFSAIRQSVDIEQRNNVILAMDSAGTYYWRVYPTSAENDAERMADAAKGQFNLAYSQEPELIAPAEGFVYNYRTKKPVVRMYWASKNQDAWYQVEIANNANMNNPEIMLVQESSMVTSSLDAGDWYWRATPIYPNGFLVNNTPSKIGHFKIEQSGELYAPQLLTPAAETAIDIAEKNSSAYFSWKHDPEAVSYTIQISASQNLENPIISNVTNNNYYAYPISQNTLTEGQYYWAVYETDREGNRSPVSERRSFTAEEVEIIYETTFPPDNYAVADTRLADTVFTWKSSVSFPNRFQIAESRDFSRPIIDEVTNASRYQISALPIGYYYWRIITENDTEPLSSEPKSLSVVGPLPAPKTMSPLAGQSLVFKPDTNVNFTWEAVDEADYYEFKLYRGNQQIFENLSNEMTSQSYAMNDLRQGEYRWTVQAFVAAANTSAVQRSGLISSNTVSVRELQHVRLEYPLQGHRYSGLTALYNPDSVRWSSAESISNSRFILSTNPNPLANPRSIIMDTQNPSTTIKLPPLREGTYYWTIAAYTSDDVNISAERASSFSVLAMPPLPSAKVMTPQNNHAFGIDELSAIKNITFAWQPVEGANRYIFSLHVRNASGALTQIVGNQSLNGTSYTYENLSALIDSGSAFEWRVEAQNRRSDGTIDRRGTIAEYRFMIDLPEIGTIETRDPGILYGN